MISLDNIKAYAVERDSDFIHFLLNTEVNRSAIGELYWQGNTEDYGNEFMIPTWGIDELEEALDNDEDDNESEKLSTFLTDDAIEYVVEVMQSL